MDYKQREEIFSKEALSIKDVMELVGCSKDKAAVLIRNWKRNIILTKERKPRLEVEGKIHILDYFDVMNINPDTPGDRYCKKPSYPEYEVLGVDLAGA